MSAGRPVGNALLAILGAPAPVPRPSPTDKTTISVDATWLASGRTGSHELQAGLFAQPRVQALQQDFINDGFNIQDSVLRRAGDPASGTIAFHRQIMYGTRLAQAWQRTSDYAVYVQDAWRPTTRLTVNAGLRVDRVLVHDDLYDLTTQNSVEIGPRLGVNYAVTADGRNVARAHWVLVHDQPGKVTMTGTPTIGQSDLYDLDLDGTFETVFETPATVGRTTNRSVDRDFHQPYVVDWGIGYRRQLPGNVAVGADFVHRRFADRSTLVETNGKYNGEVFEGYLDEAFNEIIPGDEQPLEHPGVRVARPLDHETHGTHAGHRQLRAAVAPHRRHLAAERSGVVHPARRVRERQGHRQHFRGRLGPDRRQQPLRHPHDELRERHRSMAGPRRQDWRDSTSSGWAFHVAANYTFQSGSWSGPMVSRLAAPDPAFGPDHGQALERPRRHEPSRDHDPVRLRDAQRRSN